MRKLQKVKDILVSGGNVELAIDFDGATGRLTDAYLPLINYAKGTKLTAKDITAWEWWKLPEIVDLGITEDDFYGALDTLHSYNLAHKLIDPYDEYTIPTLARIFDSDNIKAYILTQKPPRQHDEIRRWFIRHGLPEPKIATMPDGGRVKNKWAFGWDFLIEDNPEVYDEAIKRQDKSRSVFLMRAPWNADRSTMHTEPLVYGCHSWRTISYYLFGDC